MKRFFIIFTLLAAITVFVLSPLFTESSVAESIATVFEREDDETYLILKEFVETCPRRTAFTEGETAAAEYLKDKFEEIGLEGVETQVFSYGESKSQNVVGRIYSATATSKQIVVGAHYDNVVSGGSDGTFDNGSGVAALIYVAKKLVSADLGFNVEFVLFGAEEEGMVGSYFYAEQHLDKDDTMLFVNIDMIGGGDFLYAYGEDVKTDFENFFAVASEKAGVAVKLHNMPKNKRVTTIVSGASGLPYFHAAQNSDAAYIRGAGVPSLLIFSGNMDSSYFGFVEFEKYPSGISHTPNDNIDFFKTNFGNAFVDKIRSVADTIVAAVIDEGFEAVAENAKNELISDVWRKTLAPTIVFAILLVGIIAFGAIYYKKLVKASLLGDGSAKGRKFFSKPDVEEIFDFKS